MIYLSLLHITFLEFVLSARVIDYRDQNDMSEYCQETEYCAEGTHVACMYYEPDNSMGAQCANSKEVVITKSTKETVLREINSIRSKLALGVETGKYNEPLPKAYGMNKVFWDNELAFFAQIWANQCKTKNDLCRSTKRFPNPRQIIAEVRFSYPKWQRRDKRRSRRLGVSQDNVWYSLMAAIETWYALKAYVDEAMIAGKTYEIWERFIPNDYLALIHGPTTHMGCGVSAFTKYIPNRNKLGVYNIILVVCNFATQPKTGQSVYSIQNLNPGRSSCGCPEGMEEDADCLCVRIPEKLENFAEQMYAKKASVEQNFRRNLMVPTLPRESDPSDMMKLILRVKETEQPVALFLKNELANISQISNAEEVYNYMSDPSRLREYKGGVYMRRPIKAIIAPPDYQDFTGNTDRTVKYNKQQSKTPQTRFWIRNQPKREFKKIPPVAQNMDTKFSPSLQFNPSETRSKFLGLNKQDSNQDENYSSIENIVKMYVKYKKENTLKKLKAENNFENIVRATKQQNRKPINLKTVNSYNKFSEDKYKQPMNETVDLTNAENYTRIMSLLNFLEKGIKNIHFNETGRKLVDNKIKNIYDKIAVRTEVTPHTYTLESASKEVETNFEPMPIVNRQSQFDNKNKYKHEFKKKPKTLLPKLDLNSAAISFEDLMKKFNDNQDFQQEVGGEINILSEYFNGNLAKDFNTKRTDLNLNTSISNDYHDLKKYKINIADGINWMENGKITSRLKNDQTLGSRRFSQRDGNSKNEISKISETVPILLESGRTKPLSKYLNKH